jgi:hypothetical protein
MQQQAQIKTPTTAFSAVPGIKAERFFQQANIPPSGMKN